MSIKVEEPIFESQTKTRLGSRDMGPGGPTVNKYINDFIKKELDNFLHINGDTAEEYPELEIIANMLAGKIDDATMRKLNYKVDELKEKPEQVAKEFLIEQGLID